MTKSLNHLFDNNREWAHAVEAEHPGFFEQLAQQQSPEYLWIGCADSRVPANEIVGLLPGELFVHRNVANLVIHTDLNCLSVLQYAVDVLNVKHIIVTGHYRCSGILSAMRNNKLGLTDNWLRHTQDVGQKHELLLAPLTDETERWDKLCELNVIEQVVNVCRTTILQQAWDQGKKVTVHGWIYGLNNGHIRDLNMTINCSREILPAYRAALTLLSR
jgi:carbonic anhydrase